MGFLKVEQWPIDRLIEYARNPRNNNSVVDQMAAAIHEFGFRIPIVAKSDGLVVDGHLRLKAARRLGLAEVPVALADDLTDAQVKAFRLLANKSASWAEWDQELLKIELGDLEISGFDLGLIGFDGLPGSDDLVDFSADTDQAASGSAGLTLKIGKLEIPLSEDERERLEALAKDYASKNGMYFGFAAYLCDAAEA